MQNQVKYLALILPLLYFFQNIFLWSQNIGMFSGKQIIVSFAVALVICFIVYVLMYYFLKFLTSFRISKYTDICISIFLAVLTGIVLNFFFFRTLFYPNHHIALYSYILLITALLYYKQIKKVICFLLVLLVISFGNFSYSFYKNLQDIVINTKNFSVEFKSKPNIYLFWLESFHGSDVLNNVYGVNIDSFKTFLLNNNFNIFDNNYSSSFFTLSAMTDLYSLGQVNAMNYSSGNLDAKFTIRNLLAGDENNLVLKLLKANGYYTSILTDGYYYFLSKGKYLDYNNNKSVDNLLLNIYPLFAFTKKGGLLFDIIITDAVNTKRKEKKITLLTEIKNTLPNLLANQPFFIAFKGGVFHTPSTAGVYTYKNRDEWVNSGKYAQAVSSNVLEVQEIINYIINNDKNAVIVLLGDHGATSYRRLSFDQITENNISVKDFVDDLFNVFMAVRYPYNTNYFSSLEQYINNSNVITHIFYLLSENKEILELGKNPVSKLPGNFNIVINGKIND